MAISELGERSFARESAAGVPLLPSPLPLVAAASGLYTYSAPLIPINPLPLIPFSPLRPTPGPLIPPATPSPLPRFAATDGEEAIEGEAEISPITILSLLREELRLDVDGRYPQMTASGTLFFRLTTRVHWIARLTRTGTNQYMGVIWYKDGDATALPHTNVLITVVRSLFTTQRSATVTFFGSGLANRVVTYRYASSYFRPCQFEYDCVQGTSAVTTFDTSTHPNKPATVPNEILSIESLYQRAGVDASVSSGSGIIPITIAGANQRWSDAEMHDAMILYWSRFANAPQWAAWVLFASLSESGTSLGGIMFDSIGPNHRQGTAIFEDSFIATPPAGDPNAAAAVKRIKFWTAAHEIGHTFNLAHSWQKSLGTPWIPLADEPEARSFMNYPYRVSGGSTAFFANFEYRFSDGELLFMRHAPARLVEQGFADWFDHHGFSQAAEQAEPSFALTLRVNRPKPEFEFLEPIVVELKLTNTSGDPQIVDANMLKGVDHMTIVTKRQGSRARVLQPFARYCYRGERRVLMPGESLYDSLFVSVGVNGWIVAEPGRFQLQVALHGDDGDIVSNQLAIRIAPPRGYDEEYLAQDLFTEDVGRVLTFDGSLALTSATDTLQLATEQLADRRVATHARIALGMPHLREFKSLRFTGEAQDKRFEVHGAQPGDALRLVGNMFAAETAAETLGHVDTRYYGESVAEWLADSGRPSDGARVLGDLIATFQRRRVLPSVIQALQDRQAEFLGASGVKGPEATVGDPARGAKPRR